jgi:hypothetical protein
MVGWILLCGVVLPQLNYLDKLDCEGSKVFPCGWVTSNFNEVKPSPFRLFLPNFCLLCFVDFLFWNLIDPRPFNNGFRFTIGSLRFYFSENLGHSFVLILKQLKSFFAEFLLIGST